MDNASRTTYQTYQETNITTDFESGEIKKTDSVIKHKIEAEPPFVKLYLDDVCALNGVPASQKAVLMCLIKKLDYDGYITISTRYRKLIGEELGIKQQTLSNKIQELCKTGLIKVVGQNEYKTNPYFFGRGSWVEILKERKEGGFSLVISYSSTGEREVSTVVNDE